MHIGRRFDVQLAQPRQRDVGNGYVGSQTGSHQGCSLTNHTTAKHQHLSRTHTGHTADQLTLATLRLLQVVGTVQRSHSSCHLTHRLQQRQ